MKRRNYKFLIRKAHRYLGVFIGVQFVFWTVGGLYFSWTDIEQIRGDDLRRSEHHLVAGEIASPGAAVAELRRADPALGVMKVQTVNVLGDDFWEIGVHGSDGQARSVLARMSDGVIRGPFNEAEARRIATEALNLPPPIVRAELMNAGSLDPDHEYREKPMPAWAIEFDAGLMVYVSAETGQIGAIRNTRWRIFDFLWMLHTLDFSTRDNINNWLLRGFSILGLVTILSGFALFFTSSRFFRTRKL
jgi:uncharacterized iron-regulated membrane protein